MEVIDSALEKKIRKYPVLLPLFGYKELEKGNPNPFRYKSRAEKEQEAFNKCFSNLIILSLSLLCLFPIAYYGLCNDMHINAIFYTISIASTILNFMTTDKHLGHYSKYVISFLYTVFN